MTSLIFMEECIQLAGRENTQSNLRTEKFSCIISALDLCFQVIISHWQQVSYIWASWPPMYISSCPVYLLNAVFSWLWRRKLSVLCYNRVFDHLSQLLEIKVVDRVGMQILTSTIAEVFQQAGPEICLKVKEDQMRRILQLVFEGGEDGRAELVSTLHSIAKVF